MDYRRSATNNEADGHFFTRGGFIFGLTAGGGPARGKLTYQYFVDNGAGGFNVLGPTQLWTAPPLVPSNGEPPADNAWHTYTFEYIMSVGAASIYMDGAWIFSEGTSYPGRALYWGGAPASMTIGNLMDGSGTNYAMLDNALIEDIILPVTLSAYEGRQEGDHVVIDWETTSEVNNKEYRIFRSLDAKSYTQIGTVEGKGDSNKTLGYQFLDNEPYAGIAYYSLVQIDVDGTQHGLGVRAVRYEPREDGILNIFPNPVSENQSLTVKYNVTSSNMVKVSVLDMSGREVNHLEFEATPGVNELELQTADLKQGVYIIQMNSNGRVWNERFVKL